MRYFKFASVLNFTVNFKRILTSNISIPTFFLLELQMELLVL